MVMEIKASILPEVTTKIQVSNRDQNRISCDQEIENVIYSSEKKLVHQTLGKDVFLKFKVGLVGNRYLYVNQSAEVFLRCGGETYALILEPKGIPSTTHYLSSGLRRQIKREEKEFGKRSLEEKVARILKKAYYNELQGFEVEETSEAFSLSPFYTLELKRKVEIVSQGLTLKEFYLQATQEPIQVQEKELMVKELSQGILAGAFASSAEMLVKPDRYSRFFIVEYRELKGQQGILGLPLKGR